MSEKRRIKMRNVILPFKYYTVGFSHDGGQWMEYENKGSYRFKFCNIFCVVHVSVNAGCTMHYCVLRKTPICFRQCPSVCGTVPINYINNVHLLNLYATSLKK